MDDGSHRVEKAISAIARYERAIDRPREESYILSPTVGEAALIAYGERCKEYMRAIGEAASSLDGRLSWMETVCLLMSTPKPLLDAGCDDHPMLLTQKHLKAAIAPKAKGNESLHGVDARKVFRLPEKMQSPVAIFDSPDGRSLVVVVDEVDQDDLPVIIPIRPGGQGYHDRQSVKSNFVLSVYGRRDFESYFRYAASEDRVLYFNPEKGERLCSLSQVQFPGAFQNLSSHIIHPSRNIMAEKGENKNNEFPNRRPPRKSGGPKSNGR